MRSWSIPRTSLVAVATLPFLYPLFFLAATALRPQADFLANPVGLPTSVTLDHVRFAWNTANLGQSIVNSLVAVSIGVVGLAVISTAGAFWFLRHTGFVARFLYWIVVGLWLVPWVTWILPLYVKLSDAGLTNSLVVLGIVYAAINAPFGLYLMVSYLKGGLPEDVLQASRVDGASLLQQFVYIVVPLSRPALGTLVALGFVWMWGDLFIAIILLQDPSKYTEVIAATSIAGQFRAETQATAAAALVAIVPLASVFLIAQRAIVRGFTAGVGKQ